MKANEIESIDTTLGELIMAVSDAAFELCQDQRRAYVLASLTLEVILSKAPVHGAGTDQAWNKGLSEN